MSDAHDTRDGSPNGTGGDDAHAAEGSREGPVAGAADAVSTALHGISGVLGGGEDTEDARRGLDAAADAASAVGEGARMVQGIEGSARGFGGGSMGDGFAGAGDAVGGAARGVGAISSGLGRVVSDPETRGRLQEASRVANSVGSVARDVGRALDGAVDLVSNLIGEASDVDYHLTLGDVEAHLEVTSVGFHERLSELYDGHISAHTNRHIEESDLFGKDVHLSIERGDEQRSLRGIVSSATVRRAESEGQDDAYVVTIEVVPAAYLMAQTVDSRIYQDITVPDLVERLVLELLGSRNRKVNKAELSETYPSHEYLVQHNESHVEFIRRLCAEEGIYFYFDHDEEGEDHEVLVLADSNENRPSIRESFDGRVQYTSSDNLTAGHDVATRVQRHQRIGATDAVVSGYDWSNPAMRVQHERTERGEWSGPPLEVHDHFAHVRHHDYDDGGGQYRGHSADRQARMRTERLDIERQDRSIETTVVSAVPGHTFSLEGTDDHDDEYVIVAVVAHGQNSTSGIGNYRNTLQVIPKSMPYRPALPRRRVMPGPETAIVVGPAGEEIHVDQHGRIKVQFHWDRRGQRNEHSSVWIRVAQAWSGPGWGSMFIPRIGMEVIVSFLGGDPDRPIVTGCVYNGENRPPYTLPDEKTKSTIKTNSSLGGGGSNELRFEDKKGNEEVYIHAQKDFNEVVEHDHTTRVKNCQTNTVDVDQKETIGKDQTMNVKRDRVKTIEGMEMTTVMGNRIEVVNSEEFVTVDLNRSHTVHASDILHVVENRNTTIDGQYNIKTTDHYKILQNDANQVIIKDALYAAVVGRVQLKAGTGVHYDANPDGLLKIKARGNIEVESGSKVTIKASEEIVLQVGNSSITVGPSGITLAAPTVTIEAGNLVDIKSGGQVKIKC